MITSLKKKRTWFPILTFLLIVAFPMVALSAQSAGGEHRGVNQWGLFWRFFNFFLLFGILYYFLGKQVKGFLVERKAGIERSIESARVTREQAERRFNEYEAQLKMIDQEISKIRGEAEAERGRLHERLEQEAKSVSNRIVQQAKRTIDLETAQAKATLRREASLLALELAEEQLKNQLDQNDHRRLVEEYIEKVR